VIQITNLSKCSK